MNKLIDFFSRYQRALIIGAIITFLGSMFYLIFCGFYPQTFDSVKKIFRPSSGVVQSSPFRYANFRFREDPIHPFEPMTNLTNDILLEDMYEAYGISKDSHLNRRDLPRGSYAYKQRLIKKDPFVGFEWYQDKDQELLFYHHEPFTGWSREKDSFVWFEEGVGQSAITSESIPDLSLLTRYLPFILPDRIAYLDSVYDYTQPIWLDSVDYSIILQDPELMLLSNPGGTYGSRLLGTCSTLVGLPLNVVEQVETRDGIWLHLYSGYQELGWIEDDLSETSFTYTDYNERELLDLVQEIMIDEFENIGAVVGGSFVNIDTMAQVDAYNQIIFPASTLKIYVLTEVYHQYMLGELAPDDVLYLEDSDRVPGAGNIQEAATGTPYTIDQLVELVTIYSDNTAANMLIDVVGGGDRITPTMHALGLYDTYMYGKYYNERNDKFYSTPHDAAKLFALLANGQVNGRPWDDELIDKFRLNTHTFLRSHIGGGTTSYNKSGLGETEQNDVANFHTPYGSYSLAIFTAYPDYYDGIGAQVGVVSSRVHDVFNEYRSQFVSE